MGLLILPPDSEDDNVQVAPLEISSDDSDEFMHDDSDRPSKRRKIFKSSNDMALPGQIITRDTQWMR
jgi:hypothetical protein